MSVHYDVEATLRAVREKMASISAEEGYTAGTRITLRNPETSLELRRLLLEEMNRGSKISEIVEAFSEIFASLVKEIAQMTESEAVATALITECFLSKIGETDETVFQVAATTHQGGHA